jgi:hypothetical protein
MVEFVMLYYVIIISTQPTGSVKKVINMKRWKGNVQWDWCQLKSNMNENMPIQGFEMGGIGCKLDLGKN